MSQVWEDKTRTLVADGCGRRCLTFYNLGADSLPPPSEGPKRYLIEATLDEDNMDVHTPEFDSPKPHVFQQTGSVPLTGALHAAAAAKPTDVDAENNGAGASKPLEWSLDFTSEAPVILSHDCTDLERFAKTKATWEAAAPGRADKAKKIRALFLRSNKDGVSAVSAAERIEVLPALLDPVYEPMRCERRATAVDALVEKMAAVEGEAAGLLEPLDLSQRISKKKEVAGSSTVKLQGEAAGRKAAVEAMQEQFKGAVRS